MNIKGTNKNKAISFEQFKEKWGLKNYTFYVSRGVRSGWKEVIILIPNDKIKYFTYGLHSIVSHEIKTVGGLIKRRSNHFAIQEPTIEAERLAGSNFTDFDDLEELLEYSLIRKIASV
jgi:hypothetical protein